MRRSVRRTHDLLLLYFRWLLGQILSSLACFGAGGRGWCCTLGMIAGVTFAFGLAGCDRGGPAKPPRSATGQDGESAGVSDSSSVNPIALASRSIAAGDWQTADRYVREHLVQNPTDPMALEMAGDILAQQGESEQSIASYQEAVQQSSKPSLQLFEKLARQFMASGQAYESVSVLQSAIENYPDADRARYDLTGLVTILGLNQLAVEPLRWLVRHKGSDEESLAVLAHPNNVQPDPDFCRKLLAKYPDDLRPVYALAKLDANKYQWQSAVTQLRPVVEKHPDFGPAIVLYVRALVELEIAGEPNVSDTPSRPTELMRWAKKFPANVLEMPEHWVAAGLWARHRNENGAAARAFAEAVRLDQASDGATLSYLLTSLQQINRVEEAGQVAKRFEQLANLHDATKTFYERKSQSQFAAMKVAYLMVELGRLWEAEAWTRLAKSLPNDPVASIEQAHQVILSKLRPDTPWQTSIGLVADQIKIDDLPEFTWSTRIVDEVKAVASVPNPTIQFSNQAAERGLIHVVEIDPRAEKDGHWIYQSTGGGAGVIDLDLDGWPDVALANLDGHPLQEDSKPNRLFRNLDGKFSDVTPGCGYNDKGFAQGITVGDYNDDGFADVLDCNIGTNRLFRNNGDGTLTDITSQVGLSSNAWTASAVIADIDGDGNADIFEVNYCDNNGPYDKPCRSPANGQLSSCPPLHFDARADQLWAGSAEGTFVDKSKSWMGPTSYGRGLGVVAGFFDERPGMDLYVANDMTINHLWSMNPDSDKVTLDEIATLRGLAMSGQSVSQASMGMAVGDPDGDGDIDFFLTHFAEDHNTFYEQISPGIWMDRTYAIGLYEPSYDLLGFGTQFADFNNDGSSDLIITNGHVGDTGREDIGYQMPPQLFTRQTSGRWTELDDQMLGDYFTSNHLGRALVTLDANRDGLVDSLITHLYEPVALLINQSPTEAKSLGLHLRSTQSQRDAIGAIVTVRFDGKTQTSQLTAGDGYMSSNERKITVGLNRVERIDEVSVQWPSGQTQIFGPMQPGNDYLLVEGVAESIQLLTHE
jgi:tetratricopeptide (TPR) repeat protein